MVYLLPEMLERVFRCGEITYRKPVELLQYALVCRCWADGALRVLYETLPIEEEDDARALVIVFRNKPELLRRVNHIVLGISRDWTRDNLDDMLAIARLAPNLKSVALLGNDDHLGSTRPADVIYSTREGVALTLELSGCIHPDYAVAFAHALGDRCMHLAITRCLDDHNEKWFRGWATLLSPFEVVTHLSIETSMMGGPALPSSLSWMAQLRHLHLQASAEDAELLRDGLPQGLETLVIECMDTLPCFPIVRRDHLDLYLLGNPYDMGTDLWFGCVKDAHKCLKELLPTSDAWGTGSLSLVERYGDKSKREKKAMKVFAEGLAATGRFSDVRRTRFCDLEETVTWGLVTL